MKFKKKIKAMNISLFDGGAAGSAAATGTAANGEVGSEGEVQASYVNTQRSKKTGDYSNVVFGKQQEENLDAEGDNNVPQKSLEDRRKSFNELINGEYKDLFTEKTQSIIDRRFKETKGLEAQLKSAAPVLDMLMQHYNIENNDMAKLLEAVEGDNRYWEEAAYEAGMDVEQYKRLQQLERENKAFAEAERQRKGRQQADAQIQQWYREADELSQIYPDFDLNAEVQNPQFIAMLRTGLPMEHAYKVIHMDEIIQQNAFSAAADREKKVVDNIRAKGRRPAENGTSNQSAFTIKDDVSKLSKSDREEIVRRVARGENIRF